MCASSPRAPLGASRSPRSIPAPSGRGRLLLRQRPRPAPAAGRRAGASVPGEIERAAFLDKLVANLASAAPGHRLTCTATPQRLSADRAVPIGLLVNELVTNAVKYAYPPRTHLEGGAIRVRAERDLDILLVEVADDGIGLPDDFEIGRASRSLGMRVVGSLVRQLGAQVSIPETG